MRFTARSYHTALLEICDNGKSFDVEKVLFAKRYKRLGLLASAKTTPPSC